MRETRLRGVIVSAVAGVLLFYANTTILVFLFTRFPQTQALVFGRGSWWLSQPYNIKFVYVGLLAPLLEELLFRRILLQRLAGRFKKPAGLILSSLFFGLYHILFGWGWGKAANMFFVGIVFGLAYLRYGFRGALSCHYVNNLLAVAAMR